MKLASGGIKEEARQTIENIKSSLEAHGYFPQAREGVATRRYLYV